MSTAPAASSASPVTRVGELRIQPFPHPQGCRSYLVFDPESREALAIDPHLDAVEALAEAVAAERLALAHVLDTHTHADHPSGSRPLAERFGADRWAHESAGHAGITRTLTAEGEITMGRHRVALRHAPGHTPDHVVALVPGALFSGDSLFIGAVARTDFLGGDAGVLFDTLQALLSGLDADTLVLPGHDYQGRISTTVGRERAENAWLRIGDRAGFVRALTANPPRRPANMDVLLGLNREGRDIPPVVAAARAIEIAAAGAAGSIIDVRTPVEREEAHVAGSLAVPLDELARSADRIRATPAPRLILCRSGKRAETARAQLEQAGVRGLQVVEGGILAWQAAGGPIARGRRVIPLERQVRIAAGALVASGTALALLHPAFLLLPFAVGAGLIFAGVTDRCGMALVLARMPWNRGAAQPAAAAPTAACAAGPPPSCAAGPPQT